MANIQLKIEYENTLRRSSTSREETLRQLETKISTLLGISNVELKYRDDENDLVTIGSDQELQDVFDYAEGSGRILRLVAFPSSSSSSERDDANMKQEDRSQQQQQQQREIPFVKLARALADPQITAKIQNVFSSPIITEAINAVARAYLDSKGDMFAAVLVGTQQIPMLMGVLSDLLEQVPDLKDIKSLFEHFCRTSEFPFANAFSFSNEHCRPHHPPPPPPHFPFFGGGGNPPFRCGVAGNPPPFRNVHLNVVCDGCSSDANLKRTSFAAGHASRRGFIRGNRYKSQSLHDFDLCESCKNSNRFPERAYGPFVVIDPPLHATHGFPHHGGFHHFGRGGGRGGCGWMRGPEHRNWRAHHFQTSQEEEEEDDDAQDATKMNEEQQQQKSSSSSQNVPAAEPFNFNKLFNFEELRGAIIKGASAVAEATKNDNSEFTEIARAIAASLQESKSNEHESTVDEKPTTETRSESPTKEKDSDWVPVASVASATETTSNATNEDPFVKWGPQLHKLATLGFTDSDEYIEFLEAERGDLDAVVNRIVRRNA